MNKSYLFLIIAFATIAATFSDVYQIGDKVEDFNLKNIDGNMVSMSDYPDAKGFIITFTCNHCPFSVLYEDRIIALNEVYEPKGFPVIAINPNDAVQYPEDNFEAMQVRAKEKGFTFPYLVDEDQTVARRFGAARTPHMYVISKHGKDLTLEYAGAVDNNAKEAKDATEHYVEDAVNALLAGQKPEVTETKAIGCSIKWKEN